MKTNLHTLLATATVLLLPATALSQDGNATLNASGTWATPGIWSSSSPGFAPINGQNSQNWNATVNANTVAVDTAVSIQNLLFGGGTINGVQTLTLNGAGSSWTGGTFSGAGSTLITSGAAFGISGANAKTINARALTIDGLNATATWTGTGNLELQNGTITVQNGGLFDMQSDRTIGDNNNSLTNGAVVVASGGTLRKSASAGTTTIGGSLANGNDTVNATVSSGGLVDVQTGTLLFTGSFSNAGTADANNRTLTLAGGGSSSGNFNADAGGVVQFTGGTQTLTNGASITGAGRTSVAGGRLDVASGVTVNAANFGISSGVLGGAGTLDISSTFDFSGGAMDTTGGVTNLLAGSTASINGGANKTITSRAFNLAGTATWTGTSDINLQNAVLTVQNGGLFDMQNGQTIGDSNNNSANGSVVVGTGGILRKSVGTATSTIGGNLGNGTDTVTLTVQSGGTVQGRAGVLNLTGGGTVSGTGTLEVSTGARIDLNSAFTFNGGVINGSSDASGTGAVRNNSTMTISGPTAVNGLLEMPTGTLNGAGTLTVNSGGVFNWSGGTWSGSGTTQIATGGALNISAGVTSNTRSINIAGTGTWTGTGNIDLQRGTLTVDSGGLFDMQNNQTIGDSNNDLVMGTVSVSGILRKSVGTGTTQIGGNLGNGSDTVKTTVSSGGLVDVQTGTLLFTGSFSNAGTADANDRTLTLAGGGSSSGNFNADASGAVRFTGGTQTLTNGASITGAGRTSVAGGRLDVASGVTVNAANFGISSGVLGGAGTLDISNSFDFSGGAMDTAGVTNLLAGATANLNGSTKVITSRAFNLAGTATWTGTGDINLQNAVLTVQNGGLFDMQNAQTIGDSSNGGGNGSVVVSDGGILRKSVGTSTTQIGGNLGNGTDTVTLTVQSGGTVQGRAGVLNLTGGGTVSGTGTLEVSTGARIDLNSAFTFNGGLINGSSDGSGTGAVRNNNTMTISGPTAVNGLLEMPTGTLNGSGTLTVNSGGVFNWSGGTSSGAGVTQIAAGGALNISAGVINNTRSLNIAGTGTWTGTGNIDLQRGTLSVESGGLFDMQNSQFIGDSSNDGNMGAISVSGMLRKSVGGGTTTIGGNLGNGNDTVNAAVNAGGLVDVQSGTLLFLGAFSNAGTADANNRTLTLAGGGSSSGNFNADAGGVVQFTGGTQTLNNGASITGEGRTSVAGGRLNVASGVTVNAANFGISSGVLGGAGTLNISSTFDWTGGTMDTAGGVTNLMSGTTTTISGSAGKAITSRALNLATTATWTGTSDIQLQNGTITVQSGGLFDVQNDCTIGDNNNNSANGTVVVADGGTLRKSVGTATTTIGGSLGNGTDTVLLTVQSGGTVQARTGVLSLIGGSHSVAGTLEVSSGARIDLNSTSTFNSGALINGSSDASGTGAVRNNSTMTISGPTAVNGLLEMPAGTLNGGGTLTVNSGGVFNWSGGTMSGAGITQIDAGGTLNISAGVTNHTRSINLAGTGIWTGTGNIDLQRGTTTVQGGGLFDMQNNQFIGDTSNDGNMGAISVSGILRKSVGVGITTIGGSLGNGNDTVNTTVNTGGLVDVQSGTLRFLGTFSNNGTADANDKTLLLNGGGSSSGNFNADLGGVVQFTGGTQTLTNGASITGAGRTSVVGGRLDVASGVTVAAANFGVSSGVLGGAGTLNISNSFDFSGGAMDTVGGVTNLLAGATASLNGTATKTITSRAFNIAGTTTWVGTGNIDLQNAVLTVQNGGLFDMQNSQFIGDSNNNSANGAVVVGSGGTLRKSVGTGTSTIGGSLGNGTDTVILTVQSGGTVQVQSGTISLLSATPSQSGSTLSTGNWEVSNGAALNFSAGSSNITTIGSSASVILDGVVSTFAKINSLTTNQGGFTLKNDRDFTTTGAFSNSGTVTVDGSATALTVGSGGSAAYTQTIGETVLVGGALIDASVFNLNGGELKGTGTIASSVITSGTTTIAPGLSPGALTIDGNLTLSAGNTLAMEIGGLGQGSALNGYDYLDVNGVLTLAGLLDLDFINGFEDSISGSDILTLATADSAILGAFSNVASGSRLWTNTSKSFEVWYGAGSIFGENNLVITGAPEPTRTLLLLIGVMGILGRRRRTTIRH